MRLTVNGVQIRVVDKIVIELDIAKDGDTLIHGMEVRCRGGSLTIESAPDHEAAFELKTDKTIVIRGKPYGAIFTTNDPNPNPYGPTNWPFQADTGANKFSCEDPETPAIIIEGTS